jgi:hypothetical protein
VNTTTCKIMSYSRRAAMSGSISAAETGANRSQTESLDTNQDWGPPKVKKPSQTLPCRDWAARRKSGCVQDLLLWWPGRIALNRNQAQL